MPLNSDEFDIIVDQIVEKIKANGGKYPRYLLSHKEKDAIQAGMFALKIYKTTIDGKEYYKVPTFFQKILFLLF